LHEFGPFAVRASSLRTVSSIDSSVVIRRSPTELKIMRNLPRRRQKARKLASLIGGTASSFLKALKSFGFISVETTELERRKGNGFAQMAPATVL
jgi:hypothetical protein